MGRAILLWLIKEGFTDNLLVVEANEQEVKHLKTLFPEEEGFHFACTCDLRAIRDSHLIIVATAAPNAIITKDMLSPNAVIIDDTHPSNVAEDVTNTVLRVMAIVPGLKYEFPMDQKEPGEAVTCFAEGILLADNVDGFRFYKDDSLTTPWHKLQTDAMEWFSKTAAIYGVTNPR
jgi:predicted amino acid dehydrogenase